MPRSTALRLCRERRGRCGLSRANGRTGNIKATTKIADGDGFYDLYVYDTELYGVDMETGTQTLILRFADMDIIPQDIITLFPAASPTPDALAFGCYARVNSRASVSLLRQILAGEQKTMLTLVMLSSYPDATKAIADLNRLHEDVRIDYTVYRTEERHQDITALNLAIIAGKIPDIIDINQTPYKSYINKGLLRDLSPFMDADNRVKREKLLPNIREIMEREGGIYGLSPGFSVSTTFALASAAGAQRDGMTSRRFDEVLALLDENPGLTHPISVATREHSGFYFGHIVIADSVDYSAGICDFESEDFLQYMELCMRVPVTKDTRADYSRTILKNKITPMRDSLLTSIMRFIEERQQHGDDLIAPGFPARDRQGSLADFGHRMAITTACKNLDTAWEFIRNYVLDLEYSPAAFWGIPILQDTYNQYLIETKAYYMRAKEYQTMHNGSPIYLPMQADFDAWDALVYSITRENYYDWDVVGIVSEEVNAFLAGVRTAEETAAIIQSRASTLLAERR